MRKTKHTEGPYFVGADEAEDCPNHAHSGLALVDTGRSEDWPIARLCEWGNAAFIVQACNQHDKLMRDRDALLDAAKDLLECWQDQFGEKACDCPHEIYERHNICQCCKARAAIEQAETPDD